MIDIVERLRASNSAGMLCDEAAGEIEWLRQEHERLRAALREIVDAHDSIEEEEVAAAMNDRAVSTAPHVRFIRSVDIARAALAGNCVMSVSAFRKPQQTESKS